MIGFEQLASKTCSCIRQVFVASASVNEFFCLYPFIELNNTIKHYRKVLILRISLKMWEMKDWHLWMKCSHVWTDLIQEHRPALLVYQNTEQKFCFVFSLQKHLILARLSAIRTGGAVFTLFASSTRSCCAFTWQHYSTHRPDGYYRSLEQTKHF